MSLLNDWWILVLKLHNLGRNQFFLVKNSILKTRTSWNRHLPFPASLSSQPPFPQSNEIRGRMRKNSFRLWNKRSKKNLFYNKYIAKSKISTLDTKIGEEGRECLRNWIFPKGLEEENMSYYINPNLKL